MLTNYTIQITSHKSFTTLWLTPGSKLICAGA